MNTLNASSRSAPSALSGEMRGLPVLMPSWFEIGLCAIAIFIYGLASSFEGQALTAANYAGPVVISMAAISGIWTMIRRSINSIWTIMFWYRVALFSFFGLGSLVPFFINEITRNLIEAFFLFFPTDVLKYNLVVAFFYISTLLLCRILLGIAHTYTAGRRHDGPGGAITASNLDLRTLGILFMATGLSVNYLILYPAVLGLSMPNYPGIFAQLGQASLIGYFMLTYWALSERSRWLYLIITLAAIESAMGLVQLTKFAILFPWVMIGIGYVYHRATVFRMAMIVILLVPVYFAIAPLVSYGRATLYSPGAGQPGIAETITVLASYDPKKAAMQRSGDIQGGWARLSYVNAGTFAISQYDQGIPGDSLRYLPVVLIPRLIYPAKPAITDVSRQFTFIANGNYDSSSSPGIPAESYWTAGWLGVASFSLLFSIVVTGWSVYSLYALERQAWHLFYVVLLGMRVGTRLDGMLVADVVGPVGIGIIAHIFLQLMNRFIPRRFLLAKRIA